MWQTFTRKHEESLDKMRATHGIAIVSFMRWQGHEELIDRIEEEHVGTFYASLTTLHRKRGGVLSSLPPPHPKGSTD